MKRKRTLCCDVDDTISFTVDRDYENSTPIKEMISKLNRLYNEGWEIIYFTARGQLSTGYDLEEIEKTRRPVLEEWLSKHNVKYTRLLMGKPFADFYIDDKAMTPDMFLEEDFGLKLQEGRSGAEVSRVGDLVLKVAENSQMQVDWYMNSGRIPTPTVVDSAPSVYRMEYLKGRPGWKDVTPATVSTLCDYVRDFMVMPPIEGYEGKYSDYVYRCIRMLPADTQKRVLKLALKHDLQDEQSFCHGDLTLTNVIVGDKVYLIDPSIQKGIWSSWLIDLGRLMQSFRSNYEVNFLGAQEDSKHVFVPYILDDLGVSQELGLLMELLIHCRIWHHQKEHSEDHGKETMAEILLLIEVLEL